MDSFLYYLCCFGCCNLCCEPKFVKKDKNPKEKQKTINILKSLTPKHSLKSMPSDPRSMKTNEMTDYYEIPNREFKTANEVMMSMGFKQENLLGKGAFGEVFKGRHLNSGFAVAIKVCKIPEEMDKSSRKARRNALKSVKSELFVYENIKHPHIVHMILHYLVVEDQVARLYLILQFADHGVLSDLLTRRGPFEEKTCKIWFSQMLTALVYMHNKGIAHRDLKLANILLDSADDILIADFGLSRVVRKTDTKVLEATTFCGTVSYMAPEILEKKLNKKLRDVPYNPLLADVWSLGVILYNLLNNSFPFESSKNIAKAIQNMKQKKWTFTKRMKFDASPELQKMLKLIFESNPKYRIKMKDLSQNKWISDEYKKTEKKANEWMKINKINKNK